MNFFESFSSALLGIWGNKMRAIFTMFGIVVGISSVMVITSVGDGLRDAINYQFEELGLDELNISNTNETRQVEQSERLTISDAEFLRNSNEVLAASASYSVTFIEAIDVLTSSDRRGVTLIGVDQYAHMMAGSNLVYGRHIVKQDVNNGSNVIIIDELFSEEVFGVKNSVGKQLSIQTPFGTETFTVIGITEAAEANEFMSMFDLPFEARVPITVTQNIHGVGNVVSEISVTVRDRDNIHQVGNNLIRHLEIRNNTEDIYQVSSVAAVLDQVNTVISIFTMFLALVAGISLVVGGIGVMNIMLVSVTERTREIGIRKALGATNTIIQIQFLLEAIILTAIGGIIGMLIGYTGAVIMTTIASSLLDMQIIPTMSIQVISIIVFISAFIGIAFGVYPASKAAKLDPIESLRFE